jgi:hypothetical protein
VTDLIPPVSRRFFYVGTKRRAAFVLPATLAQTAPRIAVVRNPAASFKHFTEGRTTAVMSRQILGAVSQFEKAMLVAKLKALETGRRERLANAAAHKLFRAVA